MCVLLFSHPSFKHLIASSLLAHFKEKSRAQRTPWFPKLCSLNCTGERYDFIIYSLLCLLLWEEKMMQGVCSLGYGVQFHDLLSGSILGGYESHTDLGKKIPSERICLYFSSFSLPSRCAKPPSSLVKSFLVKSQNLTCLIFLLENVGSVCILLVFPLHQSYRALLWLQNLLCWRGGTPFELMVKK